MVSRGSILARLTDQGSGIILGANACVSWTLDGGALHAYDIAGDLSELGDALNALEGIARSSFAAVVVVTTHQGEPLAATLTDLGFTIDWEENDVRNGSPCRLVSFVREIV